MVFTPPDNGRGFSSAHIDWPEYFRLHTNRTNLLLHLFAVSFIFLIICVVRGDWPWTGIAIVVAIGLIALQGHAHRREAEAPRPFTSWTNSLRRWFLEQFVIFPVFVLTRRWWRQYRVAGDGSRYQS